METQNQIRAGLHLPSSLTLPSTALAIHLIWLKAPWSLQATFWPSHWGLAALLLFTASSHGYWNQSSRAQALLGPYDRSMRANTRSYNLTVASPCTSWLFLKSSRQSHQMRLHMLTGHTGGSREAGKQAWGFNSAESRLESHLHLCKNANELLDGLASVHKTRSFWIFQRFIFTFQTQGLLKLFLEVLMSTLVPWLRPLIWVAFMCSPHLPFRSASSFYELLEKG